MQESAKPALGMPGSGSGPTESLEAKRFEALVRAHSAIVWRTNALGAFVEPQPGWGEYVGQPFEEYRDHGGFDRVHPDDRDRVWLAWKGALEQRTPFDTEQRIWHAASQAYRWCSFRGVPIQDEDGEVLEWIGTMVDVDDRVRRESALRESERRFRSILERVQAIGLMLDAEGNVTFANDFLLSLTGWTRDEVVGRDYFDIFIRGASDIQARFRTALAEGDIFPHAENEILTRTGERRMIAWDNTVLRDADGNVQGTASIGRDITQQQQAILSLQASEKQLRTLLDEMPQLVWATRADGYCEYLSKQWLEYTGQTFAEGQGLGWVNAIHEEDRAATRDLWLRFIAGQTSYDTEYRLRGRDGEYRWFKARAAVVRKITGEPHTVYGTSTDIHDQKEAQAALRQSRENLRIALAASRTGTFRWDPNRGMFLEFDEDLRCLFGVAPEEPMRTTEDFLARVHAEDVALVLRAVDKSRQGDDFEMEYRILLPDGEVRWLYDRGRMTRDSEGKPLYLVGACTDITLRKRAEEVLLRSEKLAAAVSLAATIAHEINNPLEGLLNLIYLARQPDISGEQRVDMLLMAEREITRVSEMAKRSLRFYRGSQTGSTESVQKVLESVLYVYGPKLQQFNIILRRDYQTDSALAMPESDLRQVLYNLVSNAVDSMPSGGILAVKFSRVEGRVRITIADTGHGIPTEVARRIFRPFVTTKGETGTGLGLWVSQEILERHGGVIRFRSRSAAERCGTVFTAVLPLPKHAT